MRRIVEHGSIQNFMIIASIIGIEPKENLSLNMKTSI